MQNQKYEYVPWRDRAFVSIAETAEILARSTQWVRNRIAEGRLEGRQLTSGGPIVVTAASVAAFEVRTERAAPTSTGRKLELVIDNTK